MWTIDNRTPYSAGKTWGRTKDGVHEWIVAVKATFEIASDGRLTLADEQRAPSFVPEYHGEPGRSSLRYDADLVSVKPTTDVVLNGSAHSPGGKPRTEFQVALRVASIQKVLNVKGNRWSTGQSGASATEPVVRMPIVYERSFGGYDDRLQDPALQRMDPRNPVGCGLVSHDGYLVGDLLPNFEYPDRAPEEAGPAGFGAIDSFWSPRREFGGTYDARWRENRFPLLPDDWDPRALLCSPTDQQPEKPLSGGELVELYNLTPNGRLAFGLPTIRLWFRTTVDRRVVDHGAQLSSVVIEPDDRRVTMVWLGSVLCRVDGDYLEETVIREAS